MVSEFMIYKLIKVKPFNGETFKHVIQVFSTRYSDLNFAFRAFQFIRHNKVM